MRQETINNSRLAAVLLLGFAALILLEAAFLKGWRARSALSEDVLRVASPVHEWMQSGLSPYGPGFERELLDAFAAENEVTWTWLRTSSWDEAWKLLAQGRADMVPGLGAGPPEDLRDRVAGGPVYAGFKPLVVRSHKRFGLQRADDICRSVLITDNKRLKEELFQRGETLECSPLPVVHSDFEIDPIMSSLAENRARFALVDPGRYMLWQPFYAKVRPAEHLEGALEYRWYWSKKSASAGALKRFWKNRRNSARQKNLYEHYFGFLPEDTDYYEIHHLARTLRTRLPEYRDQIAATAFEQRINPLLLTAIIYQESRFDPYAESRTGVRGLMQITRVTAKELGIRNRLNPFQSIKGGGEYLRGLYDRLEPFEVEGWDRWFFALAAYNQGWGHLMDAIRLSKKLGGKGRTWRELKEVYPLLAKAKYYKKAAHGYARGYEAVQYVEKIRYYFYVLNGIVVLSRPEAEHLPALVPAVAQAMP
jgi:membrane-bound lytic murein transglycosylase F